MTAHAPGKPVIGLVGGVGAGKSAVAKCFASLGCAVIDSDRLAQDALDDPRVVQQLIRWWGPGVVDDRGRVDRGAVGQIVFDDPVQLKRLEALIHPIVLGARRELLDRYRGDSEHVAVVEDTPLLLEKGLDADCDRIIFVDTSRPTRERRVATERGWSHKELCRREKNQLGLDKKALRADDTIDNNAGMDACRSQVRRVLSQILQDLA